MPSPDALDRYLVLGHVVTPATNEIEIEGCVTRIEPKSMAVLVHLLDNAGEVVSRVALQDAIWGDVVVGDDSLTGAIIKLRKAFGDDARNPRLIETIPKRGYRLIAAVSHPVQQPASARGRSLLVRLGAFSALALACVLVATSVFRSGVDPVATTSRAPDGRTGVAVAPFRNLSGDPAQDYLALGIEQTILAGLAGIPEIAAMRTGTDVRPDYRLEGSVQRSGDVIRIDTQLLETENGIVASTRRYDRAFSDLLAIQSDIERDIMKALALEIDLAERTAQARGLTESIEAYDLFLQARAALLPRNKAGNARARTLYRRAIARDPDFARAYGGLALSYAAEYRNGWSDNGPEVLAQAMATAETALGIQPNLPAQHWVVGYVETQRRNLVDAVAALETALRLDPEYADAYALLGGIRTYAGAPDETVPLLRKAMRLRPDGGFLYFLLLGRAYYFLDNCEQGLINLEEAARRNPANLETHVYLASCLVRQGDRAGAEWEALEILAIEPQFSIAQFFDTYPMTAEGQKETLAGDLRLTGIE